MPRPTKTGLSPADGAEATVTPKGGRVSANGGRGRCRRKAHRPVQPEESQAAGEVYRVFLEGGEGRIPLPVKTGRILRLSSLKRFPFASADSVWWLCKFRVKQTRLAPGADYGVEKLARIRYLLDLERAHREGYQLALADWGCRDVGVSRWLDTSSFRFSRLGGVFIHRRPNARS